jgi:hypothetical protein
MSRHFDGLLLGLLTLKRGREFDIIQARSNLDFDVKCATIQFHGNIHNFQSDCWIELTFYLESPDILSYLGLNV